MTMAVFTTTSVSSDRPGELDRFREKGARATMADLDYLVIAPHPDDAELGAGGAILLLRAEGRKVGVLDLTSGEPTPHGTPEIPRGETDAATGVLGLDWRGNLGLPNRSLVADLDARHRLAGALRQL